MGEFQVPGKMITESVSALILLSLNELYLVFSVTEM